MKTKTLFARRALAAVFALSLGSAAMAEDFDGPRGGRDAKEFEARREARMKEMNEKLGLSAEQRKQMDEHRARHKESGRKLWDEANGIREAIRVELDKPDMDAQKVRALQTQLKEIEGKIADHRLDAILKAREILTPEQFKKFQELKKERSEQRGRGRKDGRRKEKR